MSRLFKFADDIKVVKGISNIGDNISLQRDLDKIAGWADNWQMDFNMSKCNKMHVGKNNDSFFST